MEGRIGCRPGWMPTRCCALKTPSGSQVAGGSFPKAKRIRVERPTHIQIGTDKLWGVMEEASGPNWKQVKPVLGALECVFRFEYQLEGERVINALQDANKLPIVTNEIGEAREKVLETFPFLESSWSNSENVPDIQAIEDLNSKAEAADTQFLEGLLQLLRKSHFSPLDVRDVALSKSLNSDYLTQQFIKGNSQTLDSELTSIAMNDELPVEARDMLVFKRGYGVQADTGRWIVQKLDYIQVLIVQSCLDTVKNLIKYGRNTAETSLRKLRAYISYGQGNGTDLSIEDFDTFMSDKAIVDIETWKKMKNIGKDAVISMNELGIPLKVMSMGGGILVTLVDRGYLPQIDVTPLEAFEEVWPVKEQGKRDPVELERSSLADSIGSAFSTGNLPDIFKQVELKQPTFERLLVVYRCKKRQSLLKDYWQAIANEPAAVEPQIRQEIQLRVYNKIPISLWKAAFPEKLLQFRLLDVIRLDLFTIIGLVAVVARAKYSSILLEIATIASIGIFTTRVLLGYKRMYDRFDNLMNELLAQKTLAGQDGAIVYLANSAALQQFKQCALAYAFLSSSKKALSAEALGRAVEDALMSTHLLQISFSSQEALMELEKMELVKSVKVGDERRYSAVGPQTGLSKIRNRWNNVFTQRTLEPN